MVKGSYKATRRHIGNPVALFLCFAHGFCEVHVDSQERLGLKRRRPTGPRIIWQRLKNIGLVTGPGGLFATRLVTESRVLATNPPATSLLKNTVLYQGL